MGNVGDGKDRIAEVDLKVIKKVNEPVKKTGRAAEVVVAVVVVVVAVVVVSGVVVDVVVVAAVLVAIAVVVFVAVAVVVVVVAVVFVVVVASNKTCSFQAQFLFNLKLHPIFFSCDQSVSNRLMTARMVGHLTSG